MVKVRVLYPYSAGARFDMTYYRDKHMPMLAAPAAIAKIIDKVD